MLRRLFLNSNKDIRLLSHLALLIPKSNPLPSILPVLENYFFFFYSDISKPYKECSESYLVLKPYLRVFAQEPALSRLST